MSKFAELPDGTRLEFPDDTADDVIQATVKNQLGVVDTPEPRTLSEKVMRGLGFGARALAETPGLAVAGLSDLLAKGINVALPERFEIPENRAATIQEGFTRMGFPEAETKSEELSQRISRAVVGAGFGPATGRAIATSPNVVTANVGRILQESPKLQATGATTGSVSGFAAREAGAPPLIETAAELVGGALGPVSVVAATRGATAVGRGALGLKDALTKTGQRKIVGNVLEEAAVDPQRVSRNLAESEAFGGLTERTTGQASRDPGLLTLERAARSLDTRGRFSQQLSEANVRRQRILDVLGGEDIAIAKTARDVTTGAQREAAFKTAKPISTDRITAKIDSILASPQGTRKVVKQALNSFKKDIKGIDDAAVLYEIRKDINAAMQGKFRDPKKSDFQLAKSQLKQVKNEIDAVIELSAPGFRKYLADYARLSADIDRRGLIQNIQERSALAASDPSTGREILSQARFKRLVNAESGTLTDEQLTVMGAIADDLDSGQAINAATVRPPGSDTAKNLTVAHIIGRSFGGSTDSPLINTLAKPFRWMTNFSEDQVQGLLVDAMLEPRLARMLIAEAKPQQINRAAQSLKLIVGKSTVGAVLGERAQSPDDEVRQ